MSEFHSPEEVADVRRDLAFTWLETLGVLKKELESHKRARGKSRGSLPEVFVKKLKICSDQLRIEYRVGHTNAGDDEAADNQDGQPRDPMQGFTVVTDEDAA